MKDLYDVIIIGGGVVGCGTARELMRRKAKVLLVNMDAIMESDPELGARLLDTFDLSVMPLVLKLGRRGVVEQKYLQL